MKDLFINERFYEKRITITSLSLSFSKWNFLIHNAISRQTKLNERMERTSIN